MSKMGPKEEALRLLREAKVARKKATKLILQNVIEEIVSKRPKSKKSKHRRK